MYSYIKNFAVITLSKLCIWHKTHFIVSAILIVSDIIMFYWCIVSLPKGVWVITIVWHLLSSFSPLLAKRIYNRLNNKFLIICPGVFVVVLNNPKNLGTQYLTLIRDHDSIMNWRLYQSCCILTDFF